MQTLRIATRKSPLALWQAEHVAKALARHHRQWAFELVAMSTTGDRLLDAPLAKVGGKGLFVKELERALLDGRADIAVHSMKDVPVQLPQALHIPVVLERGDPHDAFVASHYDSLAALPAGARVGTSSLRRRCQLSALRPDLTVLNLRGGVHTRLSKLERGDYDAIVLACAGLKRLGLEERITQSFSPDEMLPAIGQGALGIECRKDDTQTEVLLGVLDDAETGIRIAAERALNEGLSGGCQVPIAGHAVIDGDTVALSGLVARLDGSEILKECSSAPCARAQSLGHALADALRARGAGEILRAVYDNV